MLANIGERIRRRLNASLARIANCVCDRKLSQHSFGVTCLPDFHRGENSHPNQGRDGNKPRHVQPTPHRAAAWAFIRAMTTNSFRTLLVVCAALLFAGCVNVRSVKEARVAFGVPGVINFEKNVTDAKRDTDNNLTVDTDTSLQIGIFVWKSSAKDLVLAGSK